MNTPFSSSPAISFCLDEVNDDTADSVVLKTKLMVGAGYFLGRPRSRLTGPVGTIGSAVGSVGSGLSCDSSIGSSDDSIGGSISGSAGGGGNSSLV